MISFESAPVVARGPFRLIKHPNHAIIIAETIVVAAAFGAWQLCLIMTAVIPSVVHGKMKVEDQALAGRKKA